MKIRIFALLLLAQTINLLRDKARRSKGDKSLLARLL